MRPFSTETGNGEEPARAAPEVTHSWLWSIIAASISAILWVVAFAPFNFAESAYIALIPALLLATCKVRQRPFLIAIFAAFWLGWIAVLFWLRHVTFWGTVGLSGVLAVFMVLWFGAAIVVLPRLRGVSPMERISAFAILAGLWVLLEWLRTWVLSGFPWAPLALSQWERPVILQIAAWTGAYGVSFLLVFFNLCVTWTLYRRLFIPAKKTLGAWFSPDLYAAVGILFGAILLFFHTLPERVEREPAFTVGFVQPYIPANLKWEPGEMREVLDILEQQTRFITSLQPEVLLWPEAATPLAAIGRADMRGWIEDLVDETGIPLLMGNLAIDHEAEEWFNAAMVVHPSDGLNERFYAKRKLVPFGEYVPLRRVLFFIDKIVPVGSDFSRGTEPVLLPLNLPDGRVIQVGPLICYEDIFPHLGRSNARVGADVLFVATNNAWYGEEGGAYQHAGHSVLRAVETRRPVIRSGNGGWSGWIDSYGAIRSVLTDENDSIYFRGGGTAEIFQFTAWAGRDSFYVRYGDWFIGVCALLVLAGAVRYGRRKIA